MRLGLFSLLWFLLRWSGRLLAAPLDLVVILWPWSFFTPLWTVDQNWPVRSLLHGDMLDTTGRKYTALYVDASLTCALLLLAIVPAAYALSAAALLLRARLRRGPCRASGDDLRGTPQRCPESGTPAPERRRARDARPRAAAALPRGAPPP